MTRFPHGSRLSPVVARLSSPADVVLAARIMMWACILPILKQILPIRPLVKLVWRAPRLRPDAAREERVVTFARWACRLTRWKSGGNCLDRAFDHLSVSARGRRRADAGDRHGTREAGGNRRSCVGRANGRPAGESAAL